MQPFMATQSRWNQKPQLTLQRSISFAVHVKEPYTVRDQGDTRPGHACTARYLSCTCQLIKLTSFNAVMLQHGGHTKAIQQ